MDLGELFDVLYEAVDEVVALGGVPERMHVMIASPSAGRVVPVHKFKVDLDERLVIIYTRRKVTS